MANQMTNLQTPLVRCENVSVSYRAPRIGLFSPRPRFFALNDVTLQIDAGESLGIVGSSGAGKTTFAKVISGQVRPTSGMFEFRGSDPTPKDKEKHREFRRAVQYVFQNPKSSFDPRIRIGRALIEPLRSFKVEGDHHEMASVALGTVGLDKGIFGRYPHELSGGQLQRAAIARALVVKPKLLIADEPASSLDVSIRAQILNLFKELGDSGELTLVLIAHDLAAVAHTSRKLAVFDSGRVVESGLSLEILKNPQSEAAKRLVEANLAII
jgi:ABC-type glutathione transport system ATPase component